MRLTILTTTIFLLTAGPASAASSCRDGKGLFTPCIGERTSTSVHRRHGPPVTGVTDADDAARDRPARGPDVKPPLVGRAKLCRDGKGLFTPCAR